ncbi:MAG: hypothetical protein MHMPM18_004345 [Marteilia pararefringens]
MFLLTMLWTVLQFKSRSCSNTGILCPLLNKETTISIVEVGVVGRDTRSCWLTGGVGSFVEDGVKSVASFGEDCTTVFASFGVDGATSVGRFSSIWYEKRKINYIARESNFRALLYFTHFFNNDN